MPEQLEDSHALLIAAHLFTVDVSLDRQPAAELSHHRLGRCKALGRPYFHGTQNEPPGLAGAADSHFSVERLVIGTSGSPILVGPRR